MGIRMNSEAMHVLDEWDMVGHILSHPILWIKKPLTVVAVLPVCAGLSASHVQLLPAVGPWPPLRPQGKFQKAAAESKAKLSETLSKLSNMQIPGRPKVARSIEVPGPPKGLKEGEGSDLFWDPSASVRCVAEVMVCRLLI